MKPRVLKILMGTFLAGWLAVPLAIGWAQTSPTPDDSTPPPLGVATPTPTPTATATPGSPSKKGKKQRNPNDPTPTPKVRKAKEIPFPVPIHRGALNAKIPSYDQMGKLLSLLQSAKMTRIDDEHVQMDQMQFDMTEANGKDEYHVTMPKCVLNLKTNVITSEQPPFIKTKDFELTGDRVQFDPTQQSGELQGHVHMVIHNLKQVSTPGQPAPES